MTDKKLTSSPKDQFTAGNKSKKCILSRDAADGDDQKYESYKCCLSNHSLYGQMLRENKTEPPILFILFDQKFLFRFP
jgi:hypothetical protein